MKTTVLVRAGLLTLTLGCATIGHAAAPMPVAAKRSRRCCNN
ncbi:hypothetical protein CLV44_102191 [Marinobacterium halophilum]|uniref:Uncharacterized protein n=1 Tax=Marinobacterium halophilum TaxID=267374 RepID=A0A2P8F3H5_9GAMM|nr:hypothetical protein [Marinobacterium halophilum]PSL16267.1 hypothetical protein CLV44_102191 [Marinobacterium halophilum]